jgi:hypothetical protein
MSGASGTGSRMGTPFGESDFRAVTLCIKLSMSLVYQLIPIYESSRREQIPEPPKVREVLDDHPPVHPTHRGGCEDEALGENPRVPGQADVLAPLPVNRPDRSLERSL